MSNKNAKSQEKELNELQAQQKALDLEFYQAAEIFEAKMKTKIKNNLNGKFFPKHYEKNSRPSMTIPDQSMSLKTILDRFSKGLPINVAINQPIEGDPGNQGIDLRKLDLAEKEQLLEQTKQFIKHHQEKAEQKQQPQPQPAAGLPLEIS